MWMQALFALTILFVFSGPAGHPEGGHQMVYNVKKGTDLLLNWLQSKDKEYRVIELIHAGKNDLSIWLL